MFAHRAARVALIGLLLWLLARVVPLLPQSRA